MTTRNKARRSRLGNALAQVKALKAENDLRAEMLQTAKDISELQASRMQRAAGVLRSAADQFAVRDASDTAAHLRAEAELLDPREPRGDEALSPGLRGTLRDLAASCA